MNLLQKLIDETKPWYYINSDITAEHFPAPKKLRKGKIIAYEPKLTDGVWTSKGMLKEIKEKGYEPVNLYEMLEAKKTNPEIFKEGKWYCAFGQLWQDSGSDRRVPRVDADSDGDFRFSLGNLEGDWHSVHVVLCLCDCDEQPLETKTLKSDPSPLSPLDFPNLEQRIKELEDWREKVVEAFRK